MEAGHLAKYKMALFLTYLLFILLSQKYGASNYFMSREWLISPEASLCGTMAQNGENTLIESG